MDETLPQTCAGTSQGTSIYGRGHTPPRRGNIIYKAIDHPNFFIYPVRTPCMPTVPIPSDVWEDLCEDSPEMAAQVIKQLHDSAQRERQKRLDDEDES